MQDKMRTDAPAPGTEPIAFFEQWLEDARQKEPHNAEAMCLATADEKGRPHARMLLLKGVDRRGFVFFTNSHSHKGQELSGNARAAMCFYWKSLNRQVRIEGNVTPVSAGESDAYFSTRHKDSQISAWASHQSAPLDSRAALEENVRTLEERHRTDKTLPRPPHWIGYRLNPSCLEFWIERPGRLHERYLFEKEGTGGDGNSSGDGGDAKGWRMRMLYP